MDYITSKLEVSLLEDMTTGALYAAIQVIISTKVWATHKVAIDPGSSLITAVQDTGGAVADLQDEVETHEEATVDSQQAKELIVGLRNERFETKIPFSKASFNQARIESIIGSFKTAFKAAQLPGSSPLTIVTFIILMDMEEVTPPPVEVVDTTSQSPAPVSRGGQDKASLHTSGTVPAQGMRRTHTDRPQRPQRIRKKR